jgi:hypothetical protein
VRPIVDGVLPEKARARVKRLSLLRRAKLHVTDFTFSRHGEMAEWLKAHAWKACLRQKRNVGSNPTLSAKFLRQAKISSIFDSSISPPPFVRSTLYAQKFENRSIENRKSIKDQPILTCHHGKSRDIASVI